MSSQTIAFIGSGNMALSLIGGLIADGYSTEHILASDPDQDKLSEVTAKLGIGAAKNNSAALLAADVVVLAVKPQVLEAVCRELSTAAQKHQPLIVSIAAGVRECHIQEWLGGQLPIVRSMPNTPAMLQAGATALFANPITSVQQRDLAESILRAVGLTCWVDDENQIDAVTALSGSGPAYFFLIMEAMEEVGIELGLEAETARLLTLQTALGAARMAMESSNSPATLRERVTSPGGTTERAISIFEQRDIKSVFRDALTGAHNRSIELSELLGRA